jgi:hypothetical protein
LSGRPISGEPAGSAGAAAAAGAGATGTGAAAGVIGGDGAIEGGGVIEAGGAGAAAGGVAVSCCCADAVAANKQKAPANNGPAVMRLIMTFLPGAEVRLCQLP